MNNQDRRQTRTICLSQIMWDFLDFKAQQKNMTRSKYFRKHFEEAFKEEFKNFSQPNRPLRDLSLR